MAIEQEPELHWQEDAVNDVRNIYRPSQPVIEKKSDEWEHNPDAEPLPGWVVPALLLIILVLFAFLVHAQHVPPFINN